MVVVAAGGRREGVDLREVGGGQALSTPQPKPLEMKSSSKKKRGNNRRYPLITCP